MVEPIKNLVLSLQQLGLQLWHRFSPRPGNFHMPQVRPKKKKVSGGSLRVGGVWTAVISGRWECKLVQPFCKQFAKIC